MRESSWRDRKGPNFDAPPEHIKREQERKQHKSEAAAATLENHLRASDCATCGKAFDKPQYQCSDCKVDADER